MKRPGLIRAFLSAFWDFLVLLLLFGAGWGVLLIGHGFGY